MKSWECRVLCWVKSQLWEGVGEKGARLGTAGGKERAPHGGEQPGWGASISTSGYHTAPRPGRPTAILRRLRAGCRVMSAHRRATRCLASGAASHRLAGCVTLPCWRCFKSPCWRCSRLVGELHAGLDVLLQQVLHLDQALRQDGDVTANLSALATSWADL